MHRLKSRNRSERQGIGVSNNDVSEKLRRYREACALSQQQVAAALNIERSTYTKYETGKTEPNLATLVKLSVIFNVSPETLLPVLIEPEKKDLREVANADSPIYQLSKDERGLIALYRVLDKDNKRSVIETVSNLAKKQG